MILKLLIWVIIGSSLLNAGMFGNVSLAAYFGFCVTTGVASLVLFTQIFILSKTGSCGTAVVRPIPATVMLLTLATFLVCQGFATQNFGLAHYYWLAAASLLLMLKVGLSAQRFRFPTSVRDLSRINALASIHRGIFLVAFMESVIVIAQWSGMLPSLNEMFSCTGTWVNPNVTAMFLALTLLSAKEVIGSKAWRKAIIAGVVVIVFALILLQCRTALLVVAVVLFSWVRGSYKGYRLAGVKAGGVILLLFFLTFGFKSDSTVGRMQILKNGLKMIRTNPFTGVGLGQFEKEYNLFVAQNSLPSKDHVSMAYNDFLELAVEAGYFAAIIWIIFLVLLFRQLKDHSNGPVLVISFATIQLTNFGFQAIPVFALFLVYSALFMVPNEQSSNLGESFVAKFYWRPVLAIALLVQLAVCSKLILIAKAFHQVQSLAENHSPSQGLIGYQALDATLNFSSNFHEGFGDLFMRNGNFRSAALQYRQALTTTSRPDVLGKCGWSYGESGRFDSAVYYFRIIEKLQPYKFAPRFALLRLYEQRKDTFSVRSKAREILAMPVKVAGPEVDRIKSEAAKWLL